MWVALPYTTRKQNRRNHHHHQHLKNKNHRNNGSKFILFLLFFFVFVLQLMRIFSRFVGSFRFIFFFVCLFVLVTRPSKHIFGWVTILYYDQFIHIFSHFVIFLSWLAVLFLTLFFHIFLVICFLVRVEMCLVKVLFENNFIGNGECVSIDGGRRDNVIYCLATHSLFVSSSG